MTRVLLWIAAMCIRLALRGIETGPLPWSEAEQKRFAEGFAAGQTHGEAVGYQRAITHLAEGFVSPRPEAANEVN